MGGIHTSGNPEGSPPTPTLITFYPVAGSTQHVYGHDFDWLQVFPFPCPMWRGSENKEEPLTAECQTKPTHENRSLYQ